MVTREVSYIFIALAILQNSFYIISSKKNKPCIIDIFIFHFTDKKTEGFREKQIAQDQFTYSINIKYSLLFFFPLTTLGTVFAVEIH